MPRPERERTQKIVIFKDTRGEVFDEYTGWFYDEAEDGYHIYTFSSDAYHAQGFCQYHKFTFEYPHALTEFEKRDTVKFLDPKMQKHLKYLYQEANR